MRAAGPTDGNRKHHPKAAPPTTAARSLAVRVFSQPQKMVFDCVYGRLKRKRQLPTAGSKRSGDYRFLGDSTSLYHTCSASLLDFPQPPCMARRLRSALAGGTRRVDATGRNVEVVIPMATSVLWHGTQTEALELLQALSRNCSCVVTAEGVRLSTCPPHEMLSSDQRAIDGLLFARRIAAQLRTEEFNPNPAQVEVTASS